VLNEAPEKCTCFQNKGGGGEGELYSYVEVTTELYSYVEVTTELVKFLYV